MTYDHLLSKNLCEDVVRDVLTAPTPGHPLTHTCRGSSTKNPTRSSALTLTITFYCANSHPRKKKNPSTNDTDPPTGGKQKQQIQHLDPRDTRRPVSQSQFLRYPAYINIFFRFLRINSNFKGVRLLISIEFLSPLPRPQSEGSQCCLE